MHGLVGPLERIPFCNTRLLDKQLPHLKSPLLKQVLRYDLRAAAEVQRSSGGG